MDRTRALEGAVAVKVAPDLRIRGFPINGNRAWRPPGTGRDVTHVHDFHDVSDDAHAHAGAASIPLPCDGAKRPV